MGLYVLDKSMWRQRGPYLAGSAVAGALAGVLIEGGLLIGALFFAVGLLVLAQSCLLSRDGRPIWNVAVDTGALACAGTALLYASVPADVARLFLGCFMGFNAMWLMMFAALM